MASVEEGGKRIKGKVDTLTCRGRGEEEGAEP